MDKIYDFRFKPNENHYACLQELDDKTKDFLLALYLLKGNEGMIQHLQGMNISEESSEYFVEVVVYMLDIKPFQLLFSDTLIPFSLN